ncbi:oxygenase MpaB family protein [Antrihabitans cavernicola]|uniref:DUF2236 domain-containing protein n=1 Tax=Antrihabitans cavernicola TaxID=2495913 RepID=A0A5A7S9Y6_9NOCA|nr:oxygenase MpaB family protein [Spelaeibacter cavernicola]KAA0021647.1 DUF2236 domain-containing protein [Spelaeibacter cavernicola]
MGEAHAIAKGGWLFDPHRRRNDFGFFGPDSPTWKVWTNPTALIGFQRSVVLEHFDPFLTAAVADERGIYTDPRGRLDGTLSYFLLAAVGDSRAAIEASETLLRVHAKATGIEPISGKRYSANDPASQLWIHVTGWHSVLKCYEMYGPGKLSAADEARYWTESAMAAELQTCKAADIPKSRDQVRDYFAATRPRLCSSERAVEAMHYLLRTPYSSGGLPLWGLSRLIAPATIASLPKWMRQLGDFDQTRLLDRAVVPAVRPVVAVTTSPRIELAIIKAVLPMTHAVLAQHYFGKPPVEAETLTPAQARELYSVRSVTA